MLIVYTIVSVVLLVLIWGILFINQAKFGKLPKGQRLERIKKSPNYQNGSFKNLNHTPTITEGTSYVKIVFDYLFVKKEGLSPKSFMPTQKTDLLNLDINTDVLVWFGHSSYFIQIDKKRILVDPVLSGCASPIPIGTNAFKGSDAYTTEDIPEIDYLFISHDHWDHLDYETIILLKPKIKKIICGLGLGEHFEYWGFDSSIIIEKDWNEEVILDIGFIVNTVPARHFSGRGLKPNQVLWMSYVLQTPSLKIFIGGDSGYDTHFAEIGANFGPLDLAIIEQGQYDINWKYIHLLPNEVLQVATDLKAQKVLPVHHSKFVLGNHSWKEPLEKITENLKHTDFTLLTPMIGEPVYLKDNYQVFTQWWKEIK